jgi:hypothetical protein
LDADQIASYQKYWDAYFSGEAGRRRRAKFVPGDVAKTFVQTKEPELKTIFDDWLARIVCFAFSVSPQALVSQMNRATAETQKTLAEEEGFAPILAWVKSLVDDILAAEFSPDLEFAWTPTETIDPEAQERMLASYTSRGILTLNEARSALGRAPLPDAAADKAMTLTASGYVGVGPGSELPASPAERTDASVGLGKAGEWEESKHPRKPAGASDRQGGQFSAASKSSSASSQQSADSETRVGREQVAEVIAICTKGTHVETLIDGIMHYRADYDCLNGKTIQKYSIGQQLPNFLEQP